MSNGKWTPQQRDESRALLVKMGSGLVLLGAALTYLLAVPALARDNVGMWDTILAVAPGSVLLLLGILATLRGAGLDLLPLAKHIVDRIGKDAEE